MVLVFLISKYNVQDWLHSAILKGTFISKLLQRECFWALNFKGNAVSATFLKTLLKSLNFAVK